MKKVSQFDYSFKSLILFYFISDRNLNDKRLKFFYYKIEEEVLSVVDPIFVLFYILFPNLVCESQLESGMCGRKVEMESDELVWSHYEKRRNTYM